MRGSSTRPGRSRALVARQAAAPVRMGHDPIHPSAWKDHSANFGSQKVLRTTPKARRPPTSKASGTSAATGKPKPPVSGSAEAEAAGVEAPPGVPSPAILNPAASHARASGPHSSVRSLHQTLSTLEDRDEWKTVRPQWLGLRAAMPFWSFVVVGALVTGLAVLALQVPVGRSSVDPLPFVYAPLWTAVLVYWIGGVTRLWTGHVRLQQAEKKIDKGLAG